MDKTENKKRAAYEHGRMDFHAGAVCDPRVPASFIEGLTAFDKNAVIQSWIEGWHDGKEQA